MAIIHDSNLPAGGSGFTPPDGAGRKEEENPFMKKVQQAGEAKLAAIVMGESMGSGKTDSGGESLAVQIVKQAMENSAKLVDKASDLADRNDKRAQDAQSSADKSKADLYAIQLSEMSRVSADLRALMSQIDKDKAPPRDSISIIKEAKELLVLLGSGEFGGRRESAAPVAQTDQLTLQLQEMKQNHEIALERLRAETTRANNEFQVRMAQFGEDTKWKREEYEDSKGRGKENMANLMDIAQSVAVAVGKGGQSGIAQHEQHQVAAEPNAADPGFTLDATAFPCQFCHELITFPETGDKVSCSNCGAKFDIKRHQIA